MKKVFFWYTLIDLLLDMNMILKHGCTFINSVFEQFILLVQDMPVDVVGAAIPIMDCYFHLILKSVC